jgi:selenocysteine lyase/cysteine desulfurase
MHTDVDEMVLTPSTTVALNMVGEGMVASGFLQSGARALTTDQEHGGGTAWLTHWQTAGVVGSIDKVAVPYGLAATATSVTAAFRLALARAEAAGQKYSVVFASHVFTTTGVALPLADIASLVHAHGAMFVVDGAQAPGGLSLDLHETGADVYTGVSPFNPVWDPVRPPARPPLTPTPY